MWNWNKWESLCAMSLWILISLPQRPAATKKIVQKAIRMKDNAGQKDGVGSQNAYTGAVPFSANSWRAGAVTGVAGTLVPGAIACWRGGACSQNKREGQF